MRTESGRNCAAAARPDDGGWHDVRVRQGASGGETETPRGCAQAWLLRRSPVMLPIPGTSSVAHLEDNLAAASVLLTDEQFEALSDAAS